MNRDLFLNTELCDVVKSALPAMNLVKVFDVASLDKHSNLPLIYIYSPSDEARPEPYEDGSGDLDLTIDVIIYIGFKCGNDIAKEGIFQEAFWELASQAEKAMRVKRFGWYTDETETAIFEPLQYKGKAILDPNNGKGAGLGYLHFQCDCKVVNNG